MARRRKTSARRAAEKAFSGKRGIVLALVIIILIIAILAAAYYYWFIYKGKTWDDLLAMLNPPQTEQPGGEEPEPEPEPEPSVPGGTVETGELSIHFMELGNKYTGDSTLIKIGDTEVLIDAGSRQNSTASLVPYISQYCTDGVLEYVIATHAHQDHIAGFVGTTTAPGIFESFECKTIIDFPLTNADTNIYERYVEERDAEVAAGATHYTALQCWNNEDGAQRSYQLADDVTLNILYSYYYENESSNENEYSVCVLLTQGDYNYLFTGDLEEDGEEYLIEYNELPHCKLFKGGHHGSYTASGEKLLSVIQPEVVCVCCCAGSPEYTSESDNTFPSQEFIDRVAKYTDQIFCTSLATGVDLEGKKWEHTSMNGNIVVTSDGIDFTVVGSNNSTILKDTEWFKANRTWPETTEGA